MTGGLQTFGSIGECSLYRCFCFQFALFLVLIDQMHERLDQVVVDLAKAMIGKTQQVQLRRGQRHTLQFIDRVKLDQRCVIFATFIRNSSRCKEGLGKVVQWLKKLAAFNLPL